ncbi:unnamed protein product [Allacma fusca]|uniref:Uncharacterized protein n=1 Tax=Allacma fusca TaxID=39272 RepID=A0A8J2KLK5_9HEXA|nr:unnamed protein product [Allacma fusca]
MSQVKDLCPPSVGAEIERTYNFTPILKQNTPVPWSNTRDLRILENNRKEEKNDVFDGGNQFMERNPFLGGFKLALPANAPHGEIIEITMELTSEGIKHYIAICPRKAERKLHQPRLSP